MAINVSMRSKPSIRGTSTEPEESVSRPAIPPAPVLVTPKRQPKRLLIAAGVLIVVIGALAAYWVTVRATERVEVVVAATDLAWGEQIEADDLVKVQIVADPGLVVMPWDQASGLVGQWATGPVPAGSLLSARSASAERTLEDGQALVGLSVKAGQLPTTPLRPGDLVQLVTVSQPNTAGEPPVPVDATVFRTSAAISGGFIPVDVVVPVDDSARLAADAAAGRIVVVLLPGR